MNREVALECLKRYDSIHHKIGDITKSFKALSGSLDGLEPFLLIDDLFLTMVEEMLGLDRGMLWYYYESKDLSGNASISLGEEVIELRDVFHFLSELERLEKEGKLDE